MGWALDEGKGERGERGADSLWGGGCGGGGLCSMGKLGTNERMREWDRRHGIYLSIYLSIPSIHRLGGGLRVRAEEDDGGSERMWFWGHQGYSFNV
ncbi:uncharacterized protein EAE97_003185 [Botrytis byssoidea]|uniref:Uncharacterized protein n=1 Tax=Botrytis byssoidea TaxID=139641 RepID=A0A9P5IWZ8_9HELO|nr:uncharacterized protein EAE97_003185 [Botrytis byssoidea]KAF7949676.1 hypothetical protein EAE97_003185 [Botrytis byssoidea]